MDNWDYAIVGALAGFGLIFGIAKLIESGHFNIRREVRKFKHQYRKAGGNLLIMEPAEA